MDQTPKTLNRNSSLICKAYITEVNDVSLYFHFEKILNVGNVASAQLRARLYC